MYTNDSLSIKFRVKINESEHFSIIYETTSIKKDSLVVKNESKLARYSIGGYKSKFKLLRNIYIDTCKAFQLNCTKQENEKMKFKLISIELKGNGYIKNASLSENPYLELALQAGDYFLSNQNKTTGGWHTQVQRKFDKASGLHVKNNWYSAMAQGQVISLLIRLYKETHNQEYLNSAIHGIKLFKINVTDGGIRSYFMDKYAWYEEYPTFPTRMFVLNGFIYSLFGLYDLANCLEALNRTKNEDYRLAKSLYLNGIESLVKMLNLYDTGSRSYYDLRHVENQNAQPNIARWDYHMLHISLLNYLNTIENKSLFKIISKRWTDYSNGLWSKHN